MMHERPARHLGEYAKLNFPIEDGTETVWATAKGPGLFMVSNIPFYVYGVSFGDVVSGRPADDGFGDGSFDFLAVQQHSGHSTYRVLLRTEASRAQFDLHWRGLDALGCGFESVGRLYSIDVPPETDIHAAYQRLEAGERAGVWDFEEGYCGHPIPDRPP